MLCEFNLPSNPEITVRLREATVADAIDFSGLDPDFEEKLTTLFLERVQEKETWSDPREWTGEDRRFALFQYFLNTTSHRTTPLDFECSVCGKQHTVDIELASIDENYTPMQGQAFREFPWQGHNVIVKPLNGGDLENIEKHRYAWLQCVRAAAMPKVRPEDKHRLELEARSKYVAMIMYRCIAHVDMPHLDTDPAATAQSRRPKVSEYIKAMSASDFKEFFERIEQALGEMRHGLQCEFHEGQVLLLVPGVKCDNHPEADAVTLRWPFRFIAVIPTL